MWTMTLRWFTVIHGQSLRVILHVFKGKQSQCLCRLENLITLCVTCHRMFHNISLVMTDSGYRVASKIFSSLGLTEIKTTG